MESSLPPRGEPSRPQRSATALDEIFARSPSFMALTVGPEHVFETANAAYYQLLQLDSSILGSRVNDVLVGMEAQGFLAKLDAAYRTGEACRADEAPLLLRGADGRERQLYVDIVYQPLRDPTGRVYGLVHLGSEVTCKVIARQAIENERENFRNLFRQTPELVCILRGPEHVFEFANEAHVRTLGFDATGMSVRQAQPESVEVHGILDEVYRTGKTAELHEIQVTVSHRRRFFNLTYSARRNASGAIDGIMILGVEVTDQVVAREELQLSEERLRASAQSLEAAVASRDEFLSVASHELRTPLAALKLQHQVFQRSLTNGDAAVLGPERIKRLIDQTGRQVDRLTRLIEDMLDVARIRSGKLAINREPAALATVLGEVLARFEPVMHASGTPVELDCADEVTGSFDAFRIEQVITNLLTNAMRYGAGKPVQVRLGRSGPLARLSVSDLGRGIEPEALERIFHRFERSISPNEVSGLGLGLFIARQIVEAHGGRIWAESVGLEHGSTFVVELPIEAAGNVTETPQAA